MNDKYQIIISSPELKAQVSFSDHLSSVVCLSVCPSVNESIMKTHYRLLLIAAFNDNFSIVGDYRNNTRR